MRRKGSSARSSRGPETSTARWSSMRSKRSQEPYCDRVARRKRMRTMKLGAWLFGVAIVWMTVVPDAVARESVDFVLSPAAIADVSIQERSSTAGADYLFGRREGVGCRGEALVGTHPGQRGQ